MDKISKRGRRHFRIRKHLAGTPERPRLAVFRSGKHIYAQIIDDSAGNTLVSESDIKFDRGGKKTDQAYKAGKSLAEKALKKDIKKVVFDRGGFLYHGRIKRLAEGAREGGLEF